jgi:hypothetical protein
MTTGVYRDSGHVSLVEPWAQRSEKRVFAAAEKRIRSRIEDLYALAERATDAGDCRRVVRRCLTEAEGLCEIAEATLRKWLIRGSCPRARREYASG